ncbi:MAG: M55 family metallopeptidase [Bacteroidales bacterium]|nr:M55 family metallopeptidase [Bacteroidales bacterium]
MECKNIIQKILHVTVMKSAIRVLTLCFLFLFTGFYSLSAQIKIYIETDLEGVSGVYNFTQTREKGSPENLKACEYFMGDLAAVVRGLRDGGATEILVLDGHGNQAMIPDLMIAGAKYITGLPRPQNGTWNIDKTYSGMVLFGFHAMNGTADGVLCHTQSSESENKYWYNGVESGEIAQSASVAGYFGVPAILVTGDEATCREAKKFLGDAVITVATKKGLARESAVLYPFEETRKALYEGAKKSIAAIPKCKPYIMETPVKVKEEYLEKAPSTIMPRLVTIEKVIENPLHLFD